MKTLLIAASLFALLATPAFAGDEASRLDIVNSRTNLNHSGVLLIRCAEGWVPSSSTCDTTTRPADVTPSPIPGPESLMPTRAAAETGAKVEATVETAAATDEATVETDETTDETVKTSAQSPQTSKNQLAIR